MRQADAIHVRCPGNLGLLGTILAPLFSRYLVAKYAGQWKNYPREPKTFRLQKKILRSRWWKGPVTVYGQWPNQPSRIIPFFTSVMTDEQMGRAQAVAHHKKLEEPLRVLYVGRLSADKNVDVLLSAIAKLKAEGSQIQAHIVGDGAQRLILETQANELGLQQTVNFIGAVDFERVLDFYEQAHLSVLVSNSEGWPKAIAEAMAFGLVCIGSDRGLVPWMLGEGRGFVVPPGDVEALANALRQLVTEPEAYQMMSKRAATWAQQYSLEGVREALRDLLSKQWGVSLSYLTNSNLSRHDNESYRGNALN
jgi:glycosyltransferase involved in cell wall biosynthesis